MRLGKLVVVLAVATGTLLVAGTASAQSGLDPGAYSSHQYIDAESPAVQSDTETGITRPGFRLMGLAMFWSQLAWGPASPLHSPSMLALVTPGDRRWGLR